VNFVFGGTVIDVAAGNGHLEVVGELLRAGADPNIHEPGDFSPLIRAASAGYLEIVKTLLDAGADLTYEIPEAGGALDYARNDGHKEVADYLRSRGATEQSWEHKRGIVSTDVNEFALLIKAPADDVAKSFVRARNATIWIRDIYEKSLQSTAMCFVVYQFKGHDWTLIQHIHNDYGKDSLGQDDARVLSGELATKGIYYGNSDTAGSIGYTLFDCGQEVEAFKYGQDYEQHFDEESGEEDFDEGEFSMTFHSKVRSEDVDEIDDPCTFADRFFKLQDALVPGWSESSRCTWEPGQDFTIQGWPADTFVRIDFIAVR